MPLNNRALIVDETALRLWMKSVQADMKDLTRVHLTVSKAILPIYQRWMPVKSGRLRASAKAGATQKAALIRVGRNLPYAKPVTFGWKQHNIAPHRWDVSAMPAAAATARPVYENGIRDLLAKHGAW